MAWGKKFINRNLWIETGFRITGIAKFTGNTL